MSQFKRNSQQKRIEEVDQPADYWTGQQDWTAITQEWLLKSESYCNDETTPPAPPPPNISYLCYFNNARAANQLDVEVDTDRVRKPQMSTPKTTKSAQQRNGCQSLNLVKIEPNQESLAAGPHLSLRNDASDACIENPSNASLSVSSGKGDYISQPLNPVKVEPVEVPRSHTASSLYYGSSRSKSFSEENYNLQQLKHVKVEPEEESLSSTNSNPYYHSYAENARHEVNASCRGYLSRGHQQESNTTVKIEPEPATATLLRTNKSSLGFNVYIENPRNGILASSYHSTSRSNFTDYWLPILCSIDAWLHIKNEFLSSVDRLCAGIGFFGSGPEKVFKVCASLMNSAVVKIMENGSNETAKNAYFNGFFSIYRLLSQYARDEEVLIALSDRALTNFMSSSAARVKRAVPNLGEFLMHLTISRQWKWSQISNAFMDEVDARNVFWYCVGNQKSPPAYPELIDVHNYSHDDREAKVFHATTISRNLVLFQVKFADMARSMEFTEFCTNFGRVQDILTTKLKNLFGAVLAIKNWNQFYDFLQMPRVTLAMRNSDLARAVTRSAVQGYHKRKANALRGNSKRRWTNSRKSFPY